MGTADEVALDVLINLLVGFSRDVAAVARITFGGDQLNGWARAAGGGDARAPPKVRARGRDRAGSLDRRDPRAG
jgi:hypothetical protein